MKRNRHELSKNLLQMKFMQRTKANVERELEEKSNNLDNDLLDLCRKESDRYMTTNSYLYCENLRYGRMSFKGMNAEVEKLMDSKRIVASQKEEKAEDNEDSSEVEVSKDDMAKAFKKLKTQHKQQLST